MSLPRPPFSRMASTMKAGGAGPDFTASSAARSLMSSGTRSEMALVSGSVTIDGQDRRDVRNAGQWRPRGAVQPGARRGHGVGQARPRGIALTDDSGRGVDIVFDLRQIRIHCMRVSPLLASATGGLQCGTRAEDRLDRSTIVVIRDHTVISLWRPSASTSWAMRWR